MQLRGTDDLVPILDVVWAFQQARVDEVPGTVSEGTLAVKDLGSANGTFVRINGQAPVNAGDLLLVGEQILRVDPA